MSETTYTPGPMRVDLDTWQREDEVSLMTADECTIASTDSTEDDFDYRTAALRHAAHATQVLPDLLAACEEWVKYFDDLQQAGDGPCDPIARVRSLCHGARIAQTRAAIEKAKSVT